jgi:hypothetical protein
VARTFVPIDGVDRFGTEPSSPTAGSPADGNSVNNNGETLLILTNTGTVDHTVALRIAITVDGLPVNPRLIPVPAGKSILAGPYPTGWYGTTLLLDPPSADIRIAALRMGAGLPPPGTPAAGPFAAATPVVIADLSFAGVSTDGDVLVVDTSQTPATADGNALVVTTT